MPTFGMRSVLAAAAVLTLLLAGCGGAQDPAIDAPSSDAAESSSFNEADVEFLQSMIPHHEQATEMAQLVADRTERSELQSFADKIIADQSREIDEMTSLLEDAGAEESGGMEGMEGMEGMMGEEEMQELESLSGQEFDLAFVEMMTRHHQSAIDMAEQVKSEGENPQVTELADAIIEAQQGEIEQMAAWTEEWSN